MSRTYLITGGAGFIGSHLSETLVARGDSVVALDNLSTGRLGNLDGLSGHPRFRFIQASVLDGLAVDEAVQGADVVVHLAAAVGVKLIVDHPLRSLTTNIRGSEIVLEAAHRYRRKVLIASTSEIYGKAEGPFTETTDRVLGTPSVARWAYSVAKSVDEILAFAYHKERGLPTVIVRLFNTVGPRQSPAYGMVVPRLVRQALAGEAVTVYGDGTQTRCFATWPTSCGRWWGPSTTSGPWARSSTWDPPRRCRSTSSPSASSDGPTGALPSPSSPTKRPTRPASRTCSGGCPTPPSCAASPGGNRRSAWTRSSIRPSPKPASNSRPTRSPETATETEPPCAPDLNL
ncbi:MAG: NAD-dependent epimerase/dehydratase family protein [Acidimicrobiales bacterium]